VVVRLVVDASRSLDVGDPRKIDVARRVAAAIGYLALASSERAQVLTAGEGALRMRAPLRGRGALAVLLRELDAAVPEERRAHDAGSRPSPPRESSAHLAVAVDAVVLRSRRPGMLVVVSDFLDPGPVDAALGRAASAGHDLALIQVLAPEELDPPWDGDLALEDAETGDLLEVTVDARAVEAYLARLGELLARLRATAKKHGGTYVRLATGDSLLEAVRRFVARAVD
jgi:uncharacterized protein (DUF58 family)